MFVCSQKYIKKQGNRIKMYHSYSLIQKKRLMRDLLGGLSWVIRGFVATKHLNVRDKTY